MFRNWLVLAFTLIAAFVCAQQNVGIGVTDPASRLHIHEVGANYDALQVTNSATDSAEGNGLVLSLSALGNASLTHGGLNSLSFGTDGLSRLTILPSGKIGLNTTSMIGAADFMVQSVNLNGYGGMHVQTLDLVFGKPFYGYVVGSDIEAWHYFDRFTDSWRLNVGGDRMVMTADGRMGVGTTTPDLSSILDLSSFNKGLLLPRMTTAQRNGITSPAAGLMVYDTDVNKSYLYDGTEWKSGGGGQWATNGSGLYYTDGVVGIGTTASAAYQLSLGTENKSTVVRLRSNYNSVNTIYGIDARLDANGTGDRYAVFGQVAANVEAGAAYGVMGSALSVNADDNTYGVFARVLGTTSANAYAVYAQGYDLNQFAGYFRGEVRLGNLAGPQGTIHIDPDGQGSAGVIEMFDNDGDRSFIIRGNESTGQGSDLMMYNEQGDMVIQLDADAAGLGHGVIEVYDDNGVKTVDIIGSENNAQGSTIKMRNGLNHITLEMDADVNGRGRVTTDELEIKGGADLAEYFHSTDAELEPGSVVVIDPESPAGIRLSTNKNDKAVIGVISGANGIRPGMMMGQEGTEAFGEHPVAIAGRVYVKADLSEGAIQPGDFLTSSDEPGKACKVKKLKKSQGAIIGKALTSVNSEGYVLILVQLQ